MSRKPKIQGVPSTLGPKMGQKWDFGKIAPYPVWSPKAKSWVSRLGQLQPAPAGPGPPPPPPRGGGVRASQLISSQQLFSSSGAGPPGVLKKQAGSDWLVSRARVTDWFFDFKSDPPPSPGGRTNILWHPPCPLSAAITAFSR